MTAWNIYLGRVTSDGQPIDADEHRTATLEILAAHGVHGATLYDAVGVWNGATEPTTVVLVSGLTRRLVYKLATALRVRFRQEAVGVQPTNPLEFI